MLVGLDVWIGSQSFNLSFLVMPLPRGIDSILGMSFFNRYDIWLHPRGKRILVPDVTKQKYHTLASCAYLDEDDTHLIRQAHLSDDATKGHLKNPDRVPPSSHDKRNTTPHGLAWISKDKMSESYNVSDKQMKYLLHLVENNKFDVF